MVCPEDWNKMAKDTLYNALKLEPNKRVAKNVIVFIGDGMGLSTINAARIYRGQKNNRPGEETVLEWEKFPHAAFSKVLLLIISSHLLVLTLHHFLGNAGDSS